MDFSPLFTPLVVGQGAKKLILKNRMVMAPMVTCLANSQGEVTPRMVDYYAERAKGGIGTIIVEAMDVEERMIPYRLGVFHDRFINELENLATIIREKGAAAIAQIYHTGLRGNLPGPDDVSTAQIRECIESFSRAAERVKKAGFNGVMIHGGHGYLISSFLSPLTNHRQDEYGGGGIAGMEAAIWAKRRGHRVALYEKGNLLGGQALLASLPPHKEEIGYFREFLVRQVQKLGIEVHLNCEVTPELIIRENPSAVVIATGGKQIWPQNIPMDEKMKCLNAWKVLSGKEKNLGKKIVLLGGGFVAAEISEYICEERLANEVTIVEMREAIAPDLEPISRQGLMERLQNFGVKMIPHFLIEEVTAKGVIGRDMKSKDKREIEADSVIIALGTESVEFPIQAIQNKGIKILAIGDAREPRGIAEAVREGYLAGISI